MWSKKARTILNSNSIYQEFLKWIVRHYVNFSILPKKNEILWISSKPESNRSKSQETEWNWYLKEIWIYPPPHSSSKGGSLNDPSNHNPTLKTHAHYSKRKSYISVWVWNVSKEGQKEKSITLVMLSLFMVPLGIEPSTYCPDSYRESQLQEYLIKNFSVISWYMLNFSM